MKWIFCLVLLVTTMSASAQDPTAATNELPPATLEEHEAQQRNRLLAYPPRCEAFVSRAAPLAGVIVGPTLSLAGTGVALFGSGERADGSLTGKGKGLVAAGSLMAVTGLIVAVVSGDKLKERNQARRKQTFSGCPPY
ncbi:MAG: hypothetical protein AAGF92_09700 [Myxococcota bacterium]